MDSQNTDNLIKNLVLASGQGDQDAFHTLYNNLNKRLFAFLLARTVSREDALDLMQDVFVDLWKALPKFSYKSDKQFYAFVFRIARRKIAKYYNFRKQEVEFDEKYIKSSFEIDDVDFHLLDLIRRKLKKGYQDVIYLRYWSGMSFSEIASFLGLKETTAKVRHHRALKKLQILLDKYE